MSTVGDPAQRGREIGQQLRRLLQTAPAVHGQLASRVGVGVTDLLALDHITSDRGPIGVGELSRLLGIRSASAPVVGDRLVASGQVVRGAHPRDGRRTSLNPTPSAYDDVRAALGPLIADINRITGELTADQASVVLDFLTRITAALADFADDHVPADAPRHHPQQKENADDHR
ncbi:MarR family winged helix-turn-helix transcriptional regulator [Flexivirga sp.]|uniref:MarR family winged helix-turn-helix transcriptional regulator n=1 Tax=Flexivirga sp. TaxID=1962927 RepID=UPI003F812A63